MNERRLMVRLGIVVAVAALAHCASAAIQEEFVADYGSSCSPLALGSTETLSLNRFDTSLGSLTGVTIRLFSYDTISSVVFNATGRRAAYSGATATVPVTVTASDALDALNGLVTTATGTAGPFAGTSRGSRSDRSVAGSKIIPVQIASISPGSFPYEGEGAGRFTFTVTVADSIGSYSGSGGSSLFFGGEGYSYGMVVIDYSYIAPVPEPGTLCAGLAVAGICGMAVARRLRRIPSRA